MANYVSRLSKPPELAELERQIEDLNQQKEASVAEQDFQQAAELRNRAEQLSKQKQALLTEWRALAGQSEHITSREVVAALSSLSGEPVETIENPDSPPIPIESLYPRWAESSGITKVVAEAVRVSDPRPRANGLSEYERLQTESVLQSQHVEITRGRGFVLLPHTPEFEELFEAAIEPAFAENEMKAIKANDIYSPGAILAQVWEQIRKAEVIVADVSTSNANVIYELGLCHGLHRCPILLVRDPKELPFNLRSLRYIQYDDSAAGGRKLREDLTRAVEEFLAATRSPSDEPWDEL